MGQRRHFKRSFSVIRSTRSAPPPSRLRLDEKSPVSRLSSSKRLTVPASRRIFTTSPSHANTAPQPCSRSSNLSSTMAHNVRTDRLEHLGSPKIVQMNQALNLSAPVNNNQGSNLPLLHLRQRPHREFTARNRPRRTLHRRPRRKVQRLRAIPLQQPPQITIAQQS